MADLAVVRLLAQGVSAWNAGRSSEPGATPDLTGVRILNSQLRGLNLSGVDLDGVHLGDVDLSEADLSGARINGVTADGLRIDRAVLTGAELKGSDIDRSCIRGADLRRVQTFDLRIRRSMLGGSDLSGAVLRGYTHLYNCDLTDLSCAELTAEFGIIKRPTAQAGVLERLEAAGMRIELANQPLDEDRPACGTWTSDATDEQYGLIVADGESYWISEDRYDIFISHVSAYKDAVARPLATELRRSGLRVWIDESNIGLLDDLTRVIEFGIQSSRFTAVILTPDFFGRNWTEREFAFMTGKRVLLVLVDVRPEELVGLHPGLAEARLHLDWTAGVATVAERILATVRQVPHTLG